MKERNNLQKLTAIAFCVISIMTVLLLFLGMAALRTTEDDRDAPVPEITVETETEEETEESEETRIQTFSRVFKMLSGDVALLPPPSLKARIFQFQTDYRSGFYLRSRAFGEYNGSGFDEMEPYETEAGNSMLNATGRFFSNRGSTSYTLTIDYYGGEEVILSPYYYTQSDYLSTDVCIEGKAERYDVIFTPVSSQTVQLLSVATPEEEAYREYVYAQYLSIPEETETALRAYLERVGLNENFTVREIASFVKSAATYASNFDTIPDGADVVMYFLETSKEGICQHFASAATLIYRALGIPARYVTGFYCTPTAPGQWSQVLGSNAHAWVEVYMDGIGWMPVEVTGISRIMGPSGNHPDRHTSSISGGLGFSVIEDSDTSLDEVENDSVVIDDGGALTADNQTKLTLTVASAKKIYDGTPLTLPTAYISSGSLRPGHKLDATFPDSQTNIGETDNRIETYTIYDENGFDVTSEYQVTIEDGKLTVDHRPITVEYVDGEGFRVLAGAIAPDESFSALEEAAGTLSIIDRDNRDTTDNYVITHYKAAEIIHPTDLVLRSADAEKLYDGQPLISDAYEILDGALLPGDRIEVHPTDLYSAVGTYDNTFTVTVLRSEDGVDKDVTHHYRIHYQYGTLTIMP